MHHDANISYNIGTWDLPDNYMLASLGLCPLGLGINIRQSSCAHIITIAYRNVAGVWWMQYFRRYGLLYSENQKNDTHAPAALWKLTIGCLVLERHNSCISLLLIVLLEFTTAMGSIKQLVAAVLPMMPCKYVILNLYCKLHRNSAKLP